MATETAHVIDSVLFGDQFSTQRLRSIFSDVATVQAWLDVEAALARVQARLGVIPQEAAEEISRKAHIRHIDLAALKREIDRTSHPIIPLLRAMKEACDGDAGEFVHWGATTQDIVDTGTVLQLRAALDEIESNCRAVHDILCEIARRHRDTVMVGRTHGQQALPVTFGYKAAVWIAEVRRNLERLAQARRRALVGQFSGAVGTLASLGNDGFAVQKALFDELGLPAPDIAWHVSRDGIAELVCVMAIAAGTFGKIAHEIYALQKSEIAELEEPFAEGKVGSSTMPHKRNPSACETIVAIARSVRSAAPLAIEGVVAEHERDKMVLQTEREFLPRVCCMVDAAASKTAGVLRGLRVRADMMERNLHLQNGLLLSEAVMMRLGDRLGRQIAHEAVYRISMDVFENGGTFRDALLRDRVTGPHLSAAELDALLDPHAYAGQAAAMVDQVLAEIA